MSFIEGLLYPKHSAFPLFQRPGLVIALESGSLRHYMAETDATPFASDSAFTCSLAYLVCCFPMG